MKDCAGQFRSDVEMGCAFKNISTSRVILVCTDMQMSYIAQSATSAAGSGDGAMVQVRLEAASWPCCLLAMAIRECVSQGPTLGLKM